jgi:hypothetical protein
MVMGWIASLISRGELFNEKGRSLKVYHYIYSRRRDDDNIKLSRKGCSQDLQEMGMLAGYSISHPFRGEHAKDATPEECRSAMDQTKLSIHQHGVAIGYWSERPEDMPDDRYVYLQVIQDVRQWADFDQPIILRRKLMSHLQYDLGHAGYYGLRGQCVSAWGDRNHDSGWMPAQPEIALKHPTVTEDGEPVWELRCKPGSDAFKEIEEHNEGKRDMHENIHPWFSIEDVDREEWHINWYTWREAVGIAVRYLYS